MPSGFTTNYGAVEAALATSHRIPRKAIGAFRARLGALQKMGLLGRDSMPGKGVALRYGPDQFHRFVFACELFEFGVTPSMVIEAVDRLWERRLRKIFRDAVDEMTKEAPDDVILYVGGPHLMVDAFSGAVPNVNACPLSKLADHMAAWMTMTPDDPAEVPPRALVTNLTMRLRAFHNALARADRAVTIAELGASGARGEG